MCDCGKSVRTGWDGWPDLRAPEGRPFVPAGGWVDLSRQLEASLPWPPNLPAPGFERLHSMPDYPLNITEIRMLAHTGTHVDAPCHLFEDGPDAASIPFDRLSGQGVAWRVQGGPDGAISVAQLEAAAPAMRAGDIVLLDTGWGERWGSADYHMGLHPSLAPDAAQWLVDGGVKAVCLDCPTPDLPFFHRPAGFDWPVHRTLLGNGRLIVENLAGLGTLAGRRVELTIGGLPIVGSDGAPARVFARPIAD